MLTKLLRSFSEARLIAIAGRYQMRGIVRSSRPGVQTLVVWMLIGCVAHAQGTWTKLKTNNPGGGSGTMSLLTDGTVLVQGGGISNTWTKLTPDSSGNYINGTWSNIASMSVTRLYTGNVVMPNGKYFVLGGEYSSAGGWVNTGEIYDPIANTWTATAPFPQGSFGDGQCVLLPNGKILAGYLSGPQTYLYTPSTNTWAASGSKLRNDRNNEECWLLLPGGGVLCYEIFSSPTTGPGFAQRYVSSSGSWVDAGSVPVPLSDVVALGAELGPGAVLPDGRVIQTGANNNTAIYNPTTNSWVAGPTLPVGMGADDAAGAMLPDGHFIFAADTVNPAIFTPPAKLYDFDYTTNKLTDVTPGGALGAELASGPAYVCRMLILPNGHMLFNAGNSTIWDYAPAGTPQSSWKPTITSAVKSGTTSYTLKGTRLTGISEGANYGDDAGLSTNYPIVRLTSSTGVVKYARTTNWTPGVSKAGDTTSTTVDFTLPAGYTTGQTLQINVIANGISSSSSIFTVGVGTSSSTTTNSVVTASFSGGTLTITGDKFANSVSVVRDGANLKVEGGVGTQIKVGSTVVPSYVFSIGSSAISLDVDMKEGKDILSIDSVQILNAKIQMGAGGDNLSIKNSPSSVMIINADTTAANIAGADTVVIQSSDVATSLSCDLGPFNDSFSLSASTVKSLSLLMGTGDDSATLAFSSLTSLTVDGGDGTDTLVRTTSTVTNTPTITNIP